MSTISDAKRKTLKKMIETLMGEVEEVLFEESDTLSAEDEEMLEAWYATLDEWT